MLVRDAESSDFPVLQLLLPAVKHGAHTVAKGMQLTCDSSRAAAASVADSKMTYSKFDA